MKGTHNQMMAIALALSGTLTACGGKSSSKDDPATTESTPAATEKPKDTTASSTTTSSTTSSSTTSSSTTTTTEEVDAEALLNVYPSQLALTFFSDGGSAALRLADDASTEDADEAALEDASKTPAQHAAEAKERLKGEVDDCVSEVLKRAPVNGRGETCYEFDQDQIYGVRNAQQGYLGNQNGLNDEGEACMVAFAKGKVAVVNDLLARAKGMIETMLCQAKKSDPTVEPPAADGEYLDLKEVLGDAMGAKADNIEVAELERVDIDGEPVYKSTVVMTHSGRTRTVVLVHSPDPDDAEAYHGTLYTIEHQTEDAALQAPMGPGAGQSEKDHVLSIAYARVADADNEGSYLMIGDLVRAQLHTDLVETALGDDGILDLSAIRYFDVGENDQDYGKPVLDGEIVDNANDVLSGQTAISFVLDDDGAGVTSYFENPGGNYNEAARGMIAHVEEAEDGTLKGCSVSGAALGKDNLMKAYSIAKSQKEDMDLEPIGFYHPFFYTENNNQCTAQTGLTDADGTYNSLTCTDQQGTSESKWYQPAVADATLAAEFITKQVSGIVTRQCYKLDADTGVWGLDTDEIDEEAGYELVRSTDTSKIIAPPAMGDKVKPFEGDLGGKVGKEEAAPQ